MRKMLLQFFGGRGSSGGNSVASATARASSGTGGNSGSRSSTGGGNVRYTAGQLDRLSESDRATAFNSMPTGTIVSKTLIAGERPIRYIKNEDGSWNQEGVTQRVTSRRTLAEERIRTSDVTDQQLARFSYRSGSFSSVRYPKGTRERNK